MFCFKIILPSFELQTLIRNKSRMLFDIFNNLYFYVAIKIIYAELCFKFSIIKTEK